MTTTKEIEQAVIHADRFVLRPIQVADAGLLEMYSSDKRVAEWTSRIPHPLPPGATEDFIARCQAPDRAEDNWAIDGSASGLDGLVGVIGLTRLDREQSEIGFWVAPQMWNGRIASDAVMAILNANPQDCDTIFASVFQGNDASARVLTNAGFNYLGDAETFCVSCNANLPTWTYHRKMR